MNDDIADWDTDPAYRELKRRYDAGEISRENLLQVGYVYMRVQEAIEPERWTRISEILATEKPDASTVMAIIDDTA